MVSLIYMLFSQERVIIAGDQLHFHQLSEAFSVRTGETSLNYSLLLAAEVFWIIQCLELCKFSAGIILMKPGLG